MIAISDKSLILNKIKAHYKLKSDADLARFLDVKSNVVSNWRDRNSIDYDIVFTKCDDLDLNILLKDDWVVGEPTARYLLKTDKEKESQTIPLYNFEAAAGLVTLFSGHQNILDYITIPGLPPCDGAISIRGDSMYPLLKSGDIVAYKAVRDMINGIYWGEMYVLTVDVDGDTNTVVKYVQKSDLGNDHIRLVSYNQHHAPKDIPIENVAAMALIKASIRINSML